MNKSIINSDNIVKICFLCLEDIKHEDEYYITYSNKYVCKRCIDIYPISKSSYVNK